MILNNPLIPFDKVKWLKQNETVAILLRQTSLDSFRFCSKSDEVCLSEVFMVLMY